MWRFSLNLKFETFSLFLFSVCLSLCFHWIQPWWLVTYFNYLNFQQLNLFLVSQISLWILLVLRSAGQPLYLLSVFMTSHLSVCSSVLLVYVSLCQSITICASSLSVSLFSVYILSNWHDMWKVHMHYFEWQK